MPGLHSALQPGNWSTTTSSNQFHLPVNTIDQDTQHPLDTTAFLCTSSHHFLPYPQQAKTLALSMRNLTAHLGWYWKEQGRACCWLLVWRLKTIGAIWVQSQKQKHGIPADVWPAGTHHLNMQCAKSGAGLNTGNAHQKWWKHHHPEEDCPLSSDDRGT